MAAYLQHEYRVDPDVTEGDVREALADVTADDVSVSSPISAGVPEAGIALTNGRISNRLIVTVSGHPGSWTKTSEEALRRAVTEVDGVYELMLDAGGYDPDS